MIPRIIYLLFPKTSIRLNKIIDIEDDLINIRYRHKMFFRTNHGETGERLRKEHKQKVIEFNKVKYFWMKSAREIKER